MLKKLVNSLRPFTKEVREGALFCENVLINISIKECIEFLEEKSIIENSDYDNVIGQTVHLELSIPRLAAIGYYQDEDIFIIKNKYSYPTEVFFVATINKFSDENDVKFYTGYQSIIDLINALKKISKHNYTDIDIDNSIIFRDDQSLILPFIYTCRLIANLSKPEIDQVSILASTFTEPNSEKKILFINEAIDFLMPIPESSRFTILVKEISDFLDKCNNSYQYYLRDFSYNKLKLELDSKALEFTQKIQSVINDSQTKLVTIPTAFILVFAAFDFKDLNSLKNIVSIISLFIFAIIIQIFLANQFSALNFTKANILSYKETFLKNNIITFEEKFSLVNSELTKQKNRLYIVTILLWLIPLSLLIIWLAMSNPSLFKICTTF